MLKELHREHPGICAMKAIVRTCMWWPKMDEEIEREVKYLIKEALEGNKGRSVKHRLAVFLFRYCITPHSTTGATPADLIYKASFAYAFKSGETQI